jgi:hypothetical protein
VGGTDDANAISQSYWETNNLRAIRYTRDHNPVGFGITSDGTVQPFVIKDYDEAARIVVQAIYAMVKKEWHPDVPIPPQAREWMDRVWLAKVRAPNYPKGVDQVKDQNILYGDPRWPDATWAVDAGYMGHVDRFNRLCPGVPDQRPAGTQTPPPPKEKPPVNTFPTEPNVNQPVIYRLTEDYGRFGISRDQMLTVRGNKFEGRWGARPVSVFCHVQDGVTRGSLEHWSIVDASSTVMVQRDGSILQVIDEDDGPWTNGDVNAPLQEAAWLIALGGNVNNWSLTIEAEADASNVLTTAEENAIVWQIEDWALRYPEIMRRLIQATFGHYAVNSVSRAFCGRYVAGIDARLTAWLADAGTTPDPKPAPKPISLYPAGTTPQLAKRFYELHGPLTFSWTSKEIGFDDTRSEVQSWLIRGAASIPEGGDWSQGRWPFLVDVVRRGRSNNVHVYQYSDGSVYPKIVRRDEPAQAA